MTIKTINIGTNPNDNTGEGLRDGLKKVNDNFTDSANAASKLMATDQQALYGTAGVVPDAEQVHKSFGQYGVGLNSLKLLDVAPETATKFGVIVTSTSDGIPLGTWSVLTIPSHVPSRNTLIASRTQPSAANVEILVNVSDSDGNYSGWEELLHSGNTTVDSNGFIKSASPIINLFDDQLTGNATDGVTLTKTGAGVYLLDGVEPLAESGWYIETPKDRNGNIYFTLDYEQDLTARTLTIRTYTPDYSTGPATNGAPVDITPGRFVALRFNEPPAPEQPEPVETEEE